MNILLFALVAAVVTFAIAGAITIVNTKRFILGFLSQRIHDVMKQVEGDALRSVRYDTERLKQYALAYDLDNSHDVDIMELLRMGESLEEYFGEDIYNNVIRKTIEIKDEHGDTSLAAWESYSPCLFCVKTTIKRQSSVSKIIGKSRLIMRTIVYVINQLKGGDRSGEPTSIQA